MEDYKTGKNNTFLSNVVAELVVKIINEYMAKAIF